MIYTGNCVLSEEAARTLKRAAVRAVTNARKFISIEDLFVALLQSADTETDAIIRAIPRLRALRAALIVDVQQLAHIESAPVGVDVVATKPLQTYIELAAENGRISARGLLLALLAEPKTHLLKLIAREHPWTQDREQ